MSFERSLLGLTYSRTSVGQKKKFLVWENLNKMILPLQRVSQVKYRWFSSLYLLNYKMYFDETLP